jgi:predicted nucleotidyltransferase
MIGPAARAALDELLARDDPSILGLVLSGSAARGLATELSDVDVYVVRDDDVERETSHSTAIDEIYSSVADLEQVDRHGTGSWYFRWSSSTPRCCAGAPARRTRVVGRGLPARPRGGAGG